MVSAQERTALDETDRPQRHQRIDEGPDEDARGIRNARILDPRADDPRRVAGPELDQHEQEREDDAGEGHHAGRDRRQERHPLVPAHLGPHRRQPLLMRSSRARPPGLSSSCRWSVQLSRWWSSTRSGEARGRGPSHPKRGKR